MAAFLPVLWPPAYITCSTFADAAACKQTGFRKSMVRVMILIKSNSIQDVHFLDVMIVIVNVSFTAGILGIGHNAR